MLWVEWQRAHQRANRGETQHMKTRRRGNAIADILANEGRLLHDDITSTVWRLKTINKRGTAWAKWVGYAAMAQRDPARTPDHDLPPENRHRASRTKKTKPSLPTQSKIIRRFPWATNSLGTLEYTADLYDETDEPVSGPVSIATTMLSSMRQQPADGSEADARARAYVNAFRCRGRTADISGTQGRRCLPRPFGTEGLTALSPNDALGHCMMTAGLWPQQYFWCKQCGAHTCQRARNLTRECTKQMRNPRSARLLEKGFSPLDGKLLASAPRRLTNDDVGYRGRQTQREGSITGSIESTMKQLIVPLFIMPSY